MGTRKKEQYAGTETLTLGAATKFQGALVSFSLKIEEITCPLLFQHMATDLTVLPYLAFSSVK